VFSFNELNDDDDDDDDDVIGVGLIKAGPLERVAAKMEKGAA